MMLHKICTITVFEEERKSFEDFKKAKGSSLNDDESETLIFSAGPTFEYFRAISATHTVSFSTNIYVGTNAQFAHSLKTSLGAVFFGTGTKIEMSFGASASINSNTYFGASWSSGQAAKQSVGFVLKDNDIGDNIATHVYADPVWGTPIFFTDKSSIR